MQSSFNPNPLHCRSRQWDAGRWIWCAHHSRQHNAYALFRQQFSNPDKGELTLHITADTCYRLYINGALIGDGPSRSQPWLTYYDSWPLAELLQAGDNDIAVIVYHIGEGSKPGLLLEVVDAAQQIVAASDTDWLCKADAAWWTDGHHFNMNDMWPYQEHCDLRQLPADWTTAAPDASWSPAKRYPSHGPSTKQTPPWSRLLPRDIPLMEVTAQPVQAVLQEEESLFVANRKRREDISILLSAHATPLKHARIDNAEALLTETGSTYLQQGLVHHADIIDGLYDPCLLLDMGDMTTAYVELDIEGPAGATIDIGYAERLIDGRFNNTIECNFGTRFILDGKRRTVRGMTWHGFRFLRLRIGQATDGVRIHRLQAIRTRYPYQDRGSFTSSNPKLNDIERICRHTIRLCSHDALFDTPWREQSQWLGDVAAVTVPGIYACFGDLQLPGKFYRQAAANMQPDGLISNVSNRIGEMNNNIPDYSLWWIIGLWQHYLHTGDSEWLRQFYPEAARIIRCHYAHLDDEGFLVDMPHWVFIDWAAVNKRGCCASLNAIFVGALDAFAAIAGEVGDQTSAREAEDLAKAQRQSFAQRFYDEKRGLIADGALHGALHNESSEHANLAAIRWQLVDESIAKTIITTLYESDTPPAVTEAQPFFCCVVLDALAMMQRHDLAIQLILDRWGKRMIDHGATSTYEEWSQNGSCRSGTFNGVLRSHSHAWSAYAAVYLISGILRVRICQAGAAKIEIDPVKTDFSYDITWPCRYGSVSVVWQAESQKMDISSCGKIEVVRPDPAKSCAT